MSHDVKSQKLNTSWMQKLQKILVVDDEEDILVLLKYNLEKAGYRAETAANTQEALQKIKAFSPALIILDIMMPGTDGIELCRMIRSEASYKDILICFLTARSESFTQISALDAGGDDFINKPIKPQVFLSRVKAILRRHPSRQDEQELSEDTFGELVINYENYEVKLKDNIIALAKKEFELLKLLSSKPGKVFKRKEILNKVWGNSVIVGDRTIDVHIRKLREKIGKNYIYTMKGVGYKFDF